MTDDFNRLKAEYAKRSVEMAGSERYSFMNRSYLYMRQQIQRNTLEVLSRWLPMPLNQCRILELGCGSGGILMDFLAYGASADLLFGVDLLFDRVRQAHLRLPRMPLACADGRKLPFPTGAFDIVAQFTVFSSILDEGIKGQLADEMLRVVNQKRGIILWYDFWTNPTNPQTSGIQPGEIRRLFPHCRFKFRRVTLAPPISRRLVPFSWIGSLLIEKLRIFNTHYLVAILPEG